MAGRGYIIFNINSLKEGVSMSGKKKIPWIRNEAFYPNYPPYEDQVISNEPDSPSADESSSYVPWLDPDEIIF
ncbi:hypothetical protein SY88_03830 [Clostridiales bacterium PH28_bin88]|nr:hypothetical protein SY88_03830 [Clostridiales bacterium PH28_bin88]